MTSPQDDASPQGNINVNAQVERAVPVIPPRYMGEDWDEMLENAHVVQGSDQEKGNALIGVPFVLVQITIQPGDFRHGVFDKMTGDLIEGTGCGAEHPYAYLNAIIGPPKAFEKAVLRGKMSEEQAAMFEPGDSIGSIEAGTGVYREVLSYLEDQQRLIVPEGPAGGPFGNSRFDTAGDWIGEWVCDGEHPEVTFNTGTGNDRRLGQAMFRYTWNVRLVCPRGLRVSEYSNEYTKEGRTRYFG